ncbi:MAG: SRPBCC family protein [Marmoricola sp.]
MSTTSESVHQDPAQDRAQPVPISATVEMAAPPEAVWEVVSDLARMPEFSPELRRIVPLNRRRGLGQRVLGINRRRAVVWPTTSVVTRWEPGRAVAWHTKESAATWVYEIEPLAGTDGSIGSRVTARRVLPSYSLGSKLLTPVLGGARGHDEELQQGLATTLERIRTAVAG